MPRETTVGAATGIASLRWGDSEATIRAAFPAVRTTPTYDGRDPRTGQTTIAGGDLLVPAIVEATPGLPVGATLTLERGGLAAIELWPDVEAPDEARISEGARALAARLGGTPSAGAPKQWTREGTRIEATTEEGFRFRLTPAP